MAGEGEHVPRPLGPPQRHVPGPPHLVSTNKHFVGEEGWVLDAVQRSIGSTTGCTITEKAPIRAFSWLKASTSAFTFKTLLRNYAKQALTPRSLNVKLGP